MGKATFRNIVLLGKTTCTLADVRFCDWSGGLATSLKITIRYIISYLKVFTLNSISNKSFVARTFIISFIFIPFEDSTRCHRFSHQSHRQVERSQCTSQDRHLGSKYKRAKRKYLANNFTTQEHKARLSHAPFFQSYLLLNKNKSMRWWTEEHKKGNRSFCILCMWKLPAAHSPSYAFVMELVDVQTAWILNKISK